MCPEVKLRRVNGRYDHMWICVLCEKWVKGKGKAVPLPAWSGPEGPRKLRFPDFMTTAQDGGKVSALRTGRL